MYILRHMVKEKSMIYVIDDDESVRKAFSRLFRSAGLAAEVFPGPEEFLAGVTQKANACIVADLHMPGPTGFDLQKEMGKLDLTIPVIIVSASDDAKTREYARRLGAAVFFRKPVDDQALLDEVSWVISVANKVEK